MTSPPPFNAVASDGSLSGRWLASLQSFYLAAQSDIYGKAEADRWEGGEFASDLAAWGHIHDSYARLCGLLIHEGGNPDIRAVLVELAANCLRLIAERIDADSSSFQSPVSSSLVSRPEVV